jgi:hypothetical protein
MMWPILRESCRQATFASDKAVDPVFEEFLLTGAWQGIEVVQ